MHHKSPYVHAHNMRSPVLLKIITAFGAVSLMRANSQDQADYTPT